MGMQCTITGGVAWLSKDQEIYPALYVKDIPQSIYGMLYLIESSKSIPIWHSLLKNKNM